MSMHCIGVRHVSLGTLLLAGIAALGPGCATIEEDGAASPGDLEPVGEVEEAMVAPYSTPITRPSRVGPYTVAKLADGTPAIVDGNQQRVVLHGVARPGLESAWHGEGPDTPNLLVPVPDPNLPGGVVLKPGIHPDEYAHMKQWGFDTVRLPVSWNYRCYGYRLADGLSSDPDANLPCNNPNVWEAYWKIVKDNVKKIQGQGMDVIIDVRSDGSVRADGISELTWNHMPHVRVAEDGTSVGVGVFLGRLAQELGHRPGQPADGINRSRVVFQIFHEPHRACLNTADWSESELWRVWLDGTKNPDGSYGYKTCVLPKEDGSGSVTKSFQYAGMRVLYERVREQGAQNVILVPGLDGVDLRRVAQPQYQITGATNLGYAVSPSFGFARDNGVAGIEKSAELEALFDQYFGSLTIQSKLFPVVITEFASGEPGSCTDDQQVDFLHMVMIYATRPNRQLGWAAWSWFYPASPSLRCGYYSSLIDGWRGASGGAPGPSLLGRAVQEFLKASWYIWPEVTDYSSCNPEADGSLYWALKYALPGQWVRFSQRNQPNNNAFLSVTCAAPLPPMKWGVRMVGNWPATQGACDLGVTTLEGNGFTPGGLVLEGNNDLTAMHLQGFSGPEITELPPYQATNKLWCTTTAP